MWWNSLSDFQQISFVVAITATIIMLVFLILMLIGVGDGEFDGGVDIDGDYDVDGFNDEPLSGIGGLKVFTFRSFLVLLSIGGWVSFTFEPMVGPIWSTVIGVALGAIAAILVALVYKSMSKLESNGNLDYRYTIGKTATVYLRVPKEKNGVGKVTMTLQNRYLEIDAVTLEKQDLIVGKFVTVVGLENETTLIVKERIEEEETHA